MPELQPDLDDVLQMEPEGKETAVKVDVTGPVRIQELPRKAGSTLTRSNIGVLPNALNILRADHRRAQSYLVCPSAFLVAYGDANAQDASTMALWPANVPLRVTGTVDVWVAAATGTVNVSVVTELWATGEGDE
jgi:hypothetical protein